MDSDAKRFLSTRVRSGLVAALLTLCLTGTGCVDTWQNLCSPGASPVHGTPCQVQAWWERDLVRTTDPTRGGAPLVGLAGRVYLYGPQIDYGMAAEGALVVELFNVTDGCKPTAPLEVWHIDPVTVKRLCKKDAIGWGYTLFLPWPAYQPTIKEVRLRVRYEPIKGTPLHQESDVINLGGQHSHPLVKTTNRVIRPGEAPVEMSTQTPSPKPGMQTTPGNLPMSPPGQAPTSPLPFPQRTAPAPLPQPQQVAPSHPGLTLR